MAATFTVTNDLASGAGSLSQAILDAEASPGADTITFDPSTNGLTIPTGANINNHSVTITGNGVGVTILNGQINVNAGSGGSAAATVSDVTASSINVNSGSNVTTTTTASFIDVVVSTGGINVNSGSGSMTTATFTDVVVSAGGVNVNSGSGSITTATFTDVVVSAGGVNVNSGFDGSSTTASFMTSSVMGGLSANASASTTSVTVDGSTIQGGEGEDVLRANDSGTTVVVRTSTLTSGDRGIDGSGAVVNVTNSTVSNVVGDGVAVNDGTVTLQNVTVADTGADSLNISGESTVTVGNSLFVGSVGDACTLAQPESLGGNLADDATCGFTAVADQENVSLLLGPLADNGGPTLTRLPGAGSPAIDGGVATGCPTADQRNVARPQDGDGNSTVVCDSGAVEVAAQPAVTTTTVAAVTTTTVPAVTTTTVPAVTTTTPAAGAPVTTAVPIAPVLPPTGAATSISLLAIVTLALGTGLVVIAMRRRPTT